MSQSYDLILRGGTLMTPSGRVEADLAIRDGRIAGIGDHARDSRAGGGTLPGTMQGTFGEAESRIVFLP